LTGCRSCVLQLWGLAAFGRWNEEAESKRETITEAVVSRLNSASSFLGPKANPLASLRAFYSVPP
jgi:hypothetical protein